MVLYDSNVDYEYWITRRSGISFKSRRIVPYYTIHPRNTKMYQDLRQHYWWRRMKRDVAKYVERCLTCQQVKAKHQKPIGTL